MSSRRAWTLALLSTSSLLGGAQFRGCSFAERPPDDVPLPESMGGCLVDADCVSADMCVALACAAGSCVETGFSIDEDGDRYAPIPCGDDCDDASSMIFPGATELCDGIDQDCDGELDEDAPGIRTDLVRTPLQRAVLVGMDDRFAIVGIAPTGELVAFLVGADGVEGPATILETPETGAPFAASRDASELSVVIGGAGEARLHVLTETGDGFVASGAMGLGPDGDVTDLDVGLFGGQRWVVVDTLAGARVLLRGVEERIVIARGSSPPLLATDGRNVAVTDEDDGVHFFRGDGLDLGTQRMPGELAARGLASGDGVVYAAYRDAFDHVITRVTPMSSTSPTTAPFGDRGDEVSIFYAPPRLLVTRRNAVDLRAWLFDATVARYEATFAMPQITPLPAGPPNAVSAATTGAGLAAILGAYLDIDPSSLAILECR